MAAGADALGSIASSSADMLSAVDFSSALGGDTGDTSTPDTDLGTPDAIESGDATEETPIETAGADETVDEPIGDEPGEGEPTPEAATQDPNLPDGVRAVDVNGKKEMRVNPTRWETIYGGYKTLRDFESVVGEPITPESLDVRNRAYNGQERLYADLTSADPSVQSRVLNHFLDEAARAYEEGEVGADPAVTLGQAMYETLQQRSPDAYATVRMRAASDLVGEMYAEAQRAGDKNLALGVSHLAKALGLQYKNDAEITQFLATRPANADPVANLKAENQRLQQQINEGRTATATEQWKSWQGNTRKAVTSGVHSEAVASLSEERKAWEKFPQEFETHVVTPLNKAVRDTLLKDSGFTGRIAHLENLARRAPSAQKRAEYTEQIKQTYVNRARLAVDAHKPAILREAAALLKQGSDATHARLKGAQGQRRPTGPQSPAPQSLIPGQGVVNPGGVFNSKAEAARLAALLG